MPDLLKVKRATYITPHMIRITLTGESLKSIDAECAGGNCKIYIPEETMSEADFTHALNATPKMKRRTYTVRAFRPSLLEMDIDFVDHGEAGIASRWARQARVGSFCGFAGPSKPKVVDFYADWYLLAADMSALPVACATLEAMPETAKGVALFEILSEEDKQDIVAPNGIDIHWLITPKSPSQAKIQEDFLRKLPWQEGIVQTCIAGESSVIRALRIYVINERKARKKDVYISGYWKAGIDEDAHQVMKKLDS